jgi:DNA-binding transcriptional regulator LsrR (DeoR family)
MHIHTKKQHQYFKEVIRLHYEKGYGQERISRILPIGHATVSRWIAIFAAEKGKKSVQMHKSNPQKQPSTSATQVNDFQSFEAEVSRLQSQLKHERLRADAYEEMIQVAESKFKIAIRKKTDAKR